MSSGACHPGGSFFSGPMLGGGLLSDSINQRLLIVEDILTTQATFYPWLSALSFPHGLHAFIYQDAGQQSLSN
jgi:hypothetical protein